MLFVFNLDWLIISFSGSIWISDIIMCWRSIPGIIVVFIISFNLVLVNYSISLHL